MRTALGFASLVSVVLYGAGMFFLRDYWLAFEIVGRLAVLAGLVKLGVLSVYFLRPRAARLADGGFIIRDGKPVVWDSVPIPLLVVGYLSGEWRTGLGRGGQDVESRLGVSHLPRPG